MTHSSKPLTYIMAIALAIWTVLWCVVAYANDKYEASVKLSIFSAQEQGRTYYDCATGVVVRSVQDKALIATVAHLYSGNDPDAVVTALHRDGRKATGKSVFVGAVGSFDFALVQINTKEEWQAQPIITREIKPEEELWSVGYPLAKGQIYRHLRATNRYDSTTHTVFYDSGGGPINGESGSPIYAKDGVVGILWGGATNEVTGTPASLWKSYVEKQYSQWGGGGRCPKPQARQPVIPIVRAPPPTQRNDDLEKVLAKIDAMQQTLEGISAAIEADRQQVADLNKRLADLDERTAEVENIARVPGPPGDVGPIGKTPEINYEDLAKAVAAKLKPIRVTRLDKDGNSTPYIDVFLGDELPLPPNRVQNYGVDGVLIDDESYPIGTPIKLRHGELSNADNR